MNEVQIKIRKKALKKLWIERTAHGILKCLNIEGAELSLLITDDEHIRELNRTYRGKDKPTDVLSFPICEKVGDRLILGDVVISVDRAKAQAKEMGHSLEEEFQRLLIHGIIHLLGYDHERGGEEEIRFRELEHMVQSELAKEREV